MSRGVWGGLTFGWVGRGAKGHVSAVVGINSERETLCLMCHFHVNPTDTPASPWTPPLRNLIKTKNVYWRLEPDIYWKWPLVKVIAGGVKRVSDEVVRTQVFSWRNLCCSVFETISTMVPHRFTRLCFEDKIKLKHEFGSRRECVFMGHKSPFVARLTFRNLAVKNKCDSVSRWRESDVLFLSPGACLKYPRQQRSKCDMSAVYASVWGSDPEVECWGVSRRSRVQMKCLHDLATPCHLSLSVNILNIASVCE